MARGRTVTVRLDDVELLQLRKLPGGSDASRLRTLLHASGGTDGLAVKIAEVVQQRMLPELHTTQGLIKAVGPILEQMYRKLSEQIKNK